MGSSKGNHAVAIDLMSGTFGGVCQLLVGHPFDTTKVVLQNAKTPTTPLSAVRHIISTQGVRGLYRGMGAPMVNVGAFNALLFGSTGFLNRWVRPDGGTLTPAEAAFTGALAGIPVGILAAPTELLKCRLQAQGGSRPAPGTVYTLADAQAGRVRYAGPLDAMRLIIKFEGGLKGMARGLGATLAREIPGNGFYFGAYSLVKHQFAKFQGLNDVSELGPGPLMVAGGIAGAAFWIPMLPVDVIKTRIQLDSPYNPKYKGMLDCGRQIVKADGWGGLMRGWQPCIARSVPANAVTFVAYEAAHTALTKWLA